MTYPVGFDAFVDPDIAMSFRNLSDPFTSRVPIAITNTWTATLYFRATLINPPPGYSNYTTYLGSVAQGASAYKIWEFDRAKPPARITDQLTIELRAYLDAAYTTPFGYADLACKYHLFDHTILTLVDHDDFDDGTFQGWTCVGCNSWTKFDLDGTVYLTAPYSTKMHRLGGAGAQTWHAKKTFTIGAVTRAFVVFHVKPGVTPGDPLRQTSVKVAGVLKVPYAAMPPSGKWFRLCLFLTPNQDNELRLSCYNAVNEARTQLNLDEIWVVTE